MTDDYDHEGTLREISISSADDEAGTTNGAVMRLHVPLATALPVTFRSWALDGAFETKHMTVGSCWYLDTRKPHAAINPSNRSRIHLVIDAYATPALRSLIS